MGARFDCIRSAFAAIRFTGYGETVRILAHEIYDMADFSGDELHKVQEKLSAWRQPGGRHELLSQIGRLDHVQTDDFSWSCLPEFQRIGLADQALPQCVCRPLLGVVD